MRIFKCYKCLKEKIEFEFYKRTNRPRGREYHCKTCQNKLTKEYNKKHPEKVKIWNKNRDKSPKTIATNKDRLFRFNFGITLKEYYKILDSQNSVCAICKKKEMTTKKKMLGIDHNHNTGKIRGLLCSKCNSLLGFSNDNINILNNAKKYLKRGEYE